MSLLVMMRTTSDAAALIIAVAAWRGRDWAVRRMRRLRVRLSAVCGARAGVVGRLGFVALGAPELGLCSLPRLVGGLHNRRGLWPAGVPSAGRPGLGGGRDRLGSWRGCGLGRDCGGREGVVERVDFFELTWLMSFDAVHGIAYPPIVAPSGNACATWRGRPDRARKGLRFGQRRSSGRLQRVAERPGRATSRAVRARTISVSEAALDAVATARRADFSSSRASSSLRSSSVTCSRAASAASRSRASSALCVFASRVRASRRPSNSLRRASTFSSSSRAGEPLLPLRSASARGWCLRGRCLRRSRRVHERGPAVGHGFAGGGLARRCCVRGAGLAAGTGTARRCALRTRARRRGCRGRGQRAEAFKPTGLQIAEEPAWRGVAGRTGRQRLHRAGDAVLHVGRHGLRIAQGGEGRIDHRSHCLTPVLAAAPRPSVRRSTRRDARP